MTRRCSHCNHDGHNSRTCPNRGVKIFGVRITDGSIRKSASMGNLTHYPGSASNGDALGHGEPPAAAAAADGYASEDFAQGDPSSCRERKKGVPWTEEEHRLFLLGLHKLGKGDWRGISRNYVVSRTPTQVASHAQKYFIRQTNASRRKRRTSLFDIVPDEHPDGQLYHMSSQEEEPLGNHNPPPLPPHPTLPEDCESMASNVSDAATSAVPNPDTTQHSYPAIFPPLSNALKPEEMQCSYPFIVPAFVTPYVPFPYVFWPGAPPTENKTHEVLKPIAMHRRAPMIDDESLGMSKVGADEVGGMSKLSLKESNGDMSPSFLSLKQPDGSNRHSAFHPNLQPTGPSSTNVIPAV